MRNTENNEVTSKNSEIWKHHTPVPNTPIGFTVRTTYPSNPDGVEVMLERWEAGAKEPIHSHPGDDMTVVVEGRMAIQFYKRSENGLILDGEQLILNKGDTGYIKAGRIHDAKYLQDCKIVFVHNKGFDFIEEI